MQKNWLIRTKSNHILGPVSKEKLLDLYNNGSIRPDDEICSGNGYWFFLREKDQVDSYLLGNQKQCFNPISEAPDVLTASVPVAPTQESNGDITLVGGIDLSALKDSPPATPKPQATTMKATPSKPASNRAPAVPDTKEEPEPELAMAAAASPAVAAIVPAIPIRTTPKPSAPSPTPVAPGRAKRKDGGDGVGQPTRVHKSPVAPKKRMVSDKALMTSSIIVLMVLAGILYFRKRLLKEFIETTYNQIIPSAYAQDEADIGKKKVSFAP